MRIYRRLVLCATMLVALVLASWCPADSGSALEQVINDYLRQSTRGCHAQVKAIQAREERPETRSLAMLEYLRSIRDRDCSELTLSSTWPRPPADEPISIGWEQVALIEGAWSVLAHRFEREDERRRELFSLEIPLSDSFVLGIAHERVLDERPSRSIELSLSLKF